MHKITQSVWALLILLSLILTLGTATASKGGAHWSYGGSDGPNNWGDLSPDFEQCQMGNAQSPINVTKTTSSHMDAIEFDYNNTPLHIVNNGHTIQVNYTKDSFVRIKGVVYKLLQFHFHSPSENAVKSKLYDLEMHLVHQASDGTLGVVGVLFSQGKSNPIIEQIWENMPRSKGEVAVDAYINASKLLPKNGSYFYWKGSLTTPPCSEGVEWHLLTTPLSVSKSQVKRFNALFGPNNRPLQPLHGRSVEKVKAGKISNKPLSGFYAGPPASQNKKHAPKKSHKVKKKKHSAPAPYVRKSSKSHGSKSQSAMTLQAWIYLCLGITLSLLLLLIYSGKTGLAHSLENMKTKGKIFLLSGVLIFVIILTAGLSITQMNMIGAEIVGIAERDIPLTEAITELTVHQLEMGIRFEQVRYGASANHTEAMEEAIEHFEKEEAEADIKQQEAMEIIDIALDNVSTD
ncbi:MAG: carbonic anhydrase family protein, partial [Fibrobacterales bacterium]